MVLDSLFPGSSDASTFHVGPLLHGVDRHRVLSLRAPFYRNPFDVALLADADRLRFTKRADQLEDSDFHESYVLLYFGVPGYSFLKYLSCN